MSSPGARPAPRAASPAGESSVRASAMRICHPPLKLEASALKSACLKPRPDSTFEMRLSAS